MGYYLEVPFSTTELQTQFSISNKMASETTSPTHTQSAVQAPKYMNSYKLDSDKPFNNEKVEVILKEVLSEIITEDLVYDADKIMKQAKWASGVIRDRVKEQEFDRYKIICVVTIGEKKSQDVYSIFRFLWDSERDRFATYVHENMRLFAVALCFGLYYE